jgi:hypothetical protein
MACPRFGAATSVLPRGALWRRREGEREWELLGTFDSMATAIVALHALPKDTVGEWQALREGVHPDGRRRLR